MTIVKRMRLGDHYGKPGVECMVEIEIDDDSLASHLGERAFRNRSKKSAIQAGIIKCAVRPVSAR